MLLPVKRQDKLKLLARQSMADPHEIVDRHAARMERIELDSGNAEARVVIDQSKWQ